jgi:type IV secretion system protein VirB1
VKRLLLALLWLPAVTLAGQSVHDDNIKLTTAEFAELAGRCAPSVAVETILAVAQTESTLHVDSLSLNRPIQAARSVGFNHRRPDLLRQPRTRTEAIRWMQWFSARGYTVSVGLMQVNIENARLFQLTPIQLLDPCTNISVGAALLADNYRNGIEHHQEPQQALLDAISMYNSGSATMGYTNGYVDTVLRNAPPSAPRMQPRVSIRSSGVALECMRACRFSHKRGGASTVWRKYEEWKDQQSPH